MLGLPASELQVAALEQGARIDPVVTQFAEDAVLSPIDDEIDDPPAAVGGQAGVFVCDDRDTGQQIDGELPPDDGLFRIALERLAAHA